MKTRLKQKGFTKGQIEAVMFLKDRDTYATKIKDGDKVKLDREAMIEDPNWKRKKAPFKLWCTEHFGEILTAQTYKKDRPDLWQIEEDGTNPKWLFHSSELMPTKENPVS